MPVATNIPFPDVPVYPGVPTLLRPLQVAVARDPALAIAIGTVENVLGAAVQQAPRWGIFDANGEQLGVKTASLEKALGTVLLGQLTGAKIAVLSTAGVDFQKETRISEFVIEGGSFADYNKVEMPACPVVTLAIDGSESDRTYFLDELDAACKSTDLYSVVTPEVTYFNYSVERYNYSRRAARGATLLVVEVALKEVRQITSHYAQIATPIVQPQNAAATPQVNNGMTQPSAPETSTLKSLATKLGF